MVIAVDNCPHALHVTHHSPPPFLNDDRNRVVAVPINVAVTVLHVTLRERWPFGTDLLLLSGGRFVARPERYKRLTLSTLAHPSHSLVDVSHSPNPFRISASTSR